MTFKYRYTLASDVPGGAWNDAATTRLQMLIAQNIATQLSGVVLRNDTLEVTFDSELSAEDKTTLDGNQSTPAGGLIASALNRVALLINGNLKTDNSREIVPIDGIQYVTVRVQIIDVFGQAINADGQSVCLEPTAVCAINVLDGALDAAGGFEFILGPDVRRGNVSITISVAGFTNRVLSVSFR